jgi:penicillin-binding protein 1A
VNVVFAQLALDVGPENIVDTAHRMGITVPLDPVPSITLGVEEVPTLDMASAYSTLANDGNRVWGTMGPSARSPVAIEKVLDPDGHTRDVNHVRHTRVIPYGVAQQAKSILSTVITSGTGKQAQISEFAAGKTGTTENYGDAWFVGFNKELTVAVWVGYADRLEPMKTEYHGGPVEGGTYPAEIWHDFMTSWIDIRDARDAAKGKNKDEQTTPVTPYVPQQSAPSTGGGSQGGGSEKTPKKQAAPKQKSPSTPRTPTPAPAPSPTPAPGGGGGGPSGGGVGAPSG